MVFSNEISIYTPLPSVWKYQFCYSINSKIKKKVEKSNDQKKFRKNWYFWSIIFSTRLLVTWNVKIRSDWLIGRWLNWKIFLLISNSQMCYGSIPTFINFLWSLISQFSYPWFPHFIFWTRNPKILKNFSIRKTNFSYVFIFQHVWWYEKGKSKDFVKIIFFPRMNHFWVGHKMWRHNLKLIINKSV